MKLTEALRAAASTGIRPKRVYLACGFTPLHLATFLKAWGARRFEGDGIELETGPYGDVVTAIEAAHSAPVLLVIEWPDLDPRLGLRAATGWNHAIERDIAVEVKARLERLLASATRVAGSTTVVISGPSLRLPPDFHTPRGVLSAVEAALEAAWAAFAAEAVAAGARVLSRGEAEDGDARMSIAADFPYTTAQASSLAARLIAAAFPSAPAKGLITDLDDTLWKGIAGEIGPDQVAWTLDQDAAPHGWYQRMLGSLAARGALVGAASKNERATVDMALARPGLLIPAAAIFPVEANWGLKSESVARILDIWNIGASDVVFIDDSPHEIAEVTARFPAMRTRLFPAGDPAGVRALLDSLRESFAITGITEEDKLRAASLRAGQDLRAAAADAADPLEFLAGLDGEITFDLRIDPSDARALELVNKTNQFNLNGRRFTEGEWRELLASDGAFQLTASYRDKFGPLGKIAVMAGRVASGTVEIDAWVMSCRAFSRRIEHHTLAFLSAHLNGALSFAFTHTERNQPMEEFLASDWQTEALPHRVVART